jgi:MoaA/NifB/PqqE/SkfB family radical SAM enzyme
MADGEQLDHGSGRPAERADTLRTTDIISLMSVRSLFRVMRGMVRAPFDDNYAGSPIAVCWFTNFSCNARCRFCCKQAEIRAGKSAFPPLGLDDARALLERIRKSVELLYISGGEPTIHPPIVDLLKAARDLGFSSIGMSSNLIALHKRPEILDLLDAISVSIHSPRVPDHAANLGVSEETAAQVFENLEGLRSHPRRSQFKVLVNCVINEANLDSVLEMVEFTRERGFLLELAPANEHGRMPSLAGNPRYEALIDELLELRESGKAPHLAGSTAYYRAIREFTPFRCFPYGVPNIMPDGRLCTPCDVSEQHALNLLDYPDLKAAVRASKPHLGEYPCSRGLCFKAGIVERSRLFSLLLAGKSPEDDIQ